MLLLVAPNIRNTLAAKSQAPFPVFVLELSVFIRAGDYYFYKLNIFCTSHTIFFGSKKSRRMSWAGHVARTE
jgi:hypothetical protein